MEDADNKYEYIVLETRVVDNYVYWFLNRNGPKKEKEAHLIQKNTINIILLYLQFTICLLFLFQILQSSLQ